MGVSSPSQFTRASWCGGLLLAAVLLGGCSSIFGGGSGSVDAQLVRLPGSSAVPAPGVTAAALGGPQLLTIPWTANVNISSIKTPIVAVRLRGNSAEAFPYRCPGTAPAGCLVELNGPALQDLLGADPVSVDAGTYDLVEVQYSTGCSPSSTATRPVVVTATATITGTTYYTKASGGMSTAGPAEPVSVEMAGCNDQYPISPPLEIGDGDAVTLRLYFDILDLANAALPTSATTVLTGSGCTPATAPVICLVYPTVIAVVGTVPPVIEHYRVNNGATIGLVFDAGSDAWLGGYLRRFVTEDVQWFPGFVPVGGIRSFTANSSGIGYRLEQWPLGGGTTPGAVFPNFQRSTHDGVMTYSGITRSYRAVSVERP